MIKHHGGPSLYRKRNTLGGIVLHLKDKCIGQRISPILVTAPDCAPCVSEWRQVAASPLDGAVGVPQDSAVSASLMLSHCVLFFSSGLQPLVIVDQMNDKERIFGSSLSCTLARN